MLLLLLVALDLRNRWKLDMLDQNFIKYIFIDTETGKPYAKMPTDYHDGKGEFSFGNDYTTERKLSKFTAFCNVQK